MEESMSATTTMLEGGDFLHQKVLLVDDDRAQRMLLRLPLEREGFTVLEAADGKEALTVCAEHPDLRLIVTDLSMPEMDGYELIKEIRSQAIRYMYVIVLTAADDKKAVVRALTMGADDFLSKPALPEELKLRTTSGFRLLQLESTEELIFGMAKLSEYRSEETGCHLERVQLYTRLLARDLAERCPELGLTPSLGEEIARVSPLHDIGKVAISDAILHKPGRFTDEEYEIMKKHAVIGGQLLKDIYRKTGSHWIKTAYEIAMYHHEHFNGAGYPEGTSGDDIPVSARIMALADIYDALTAERSYKKALTHDEAKALILVERSRQLDPRVVDAFLRQEDIWQTVRARFSEEIGQL
jgi:putative two-component system response regulator